jgi:hypothetical protein
MSKVSSFHSCRFSYQSPVKHGPKTRDISMAAATDSVEALSYQGSDS